MANLDVGELLRDLGLNLVGLAILVFGSYFRHYRRWDHVVGYVAFNISLFTVSAALALSTPLNVGVGFGLFGVLSIVRLRSDEASQVEIGYTMVALVLGLMTGLSGMDFDVKVVFTVLLVVAMFAVDFTGPRQVMKYGRTRVHLDRVIIDDDELMTHLATVLPGPAISLVVREIDLVRDTMTLDVVVDHRGAARSV